MKFYTMWFMALLFSVVFMSGCGSSSSTDTAGANVPTVSSTFPADFDIDVARNMSIAATFSMEMDPLTITAETFTLKQGTTPVTGVVTYVGFVATFNPDSDLAASTIYTATITTGAKDLAGTALDAEKTWTFTTGLTSDTTAPTVTIMNPDAGTIDVGINTNVSATFSEWMDPTTITDTTFTLEDGTTPIAGAVTYVGYVATFNPTSNLSLNTLYTVTITTAAKDLAGNALAIAKTWTFRSGASTDVTAPIVTLKSPGDIAIDAVVSRNVNATFSESMDPVTITNLTFTLKVTATSAAVPGAATYSGFIATFNPTNDLIPSTNYTATITTGAKDLAGNPMAAAAVWSFTTGTAIPANPDIVNLLTAGNFVITAEALISTTGTTFIVGDLALSPLAATFIQGFDLIYVSASDYSTSALVNGKIYADYSATGSTISGQAIADRLTAYQDAAGRAPSVTDLGAGDISGLTIPRGVYKWGNGVLIATDVYLEGGPNDVWIFQIGQGLTMSPGVQVHLAGGAQAKNIFWQAAQIAALDTTTHMEGTILCAQDITLATGATVNGRLLSATQVTLQANAVTQPAP